MKYKLESGKITEDGHSLFIEDILTRLKRLDFLEKYKENLVKVIDKHFWDYENHYYECEDGFLEDLYKLAKGKFAPHAKGEKNK